MGESGEWCIGRTIPNCRSAFGVQQPPWCTLLRSVHWLCLFLEAPAPLRGRFCRRRRRDRADRLRHDPTLIPCRNLRLPSFTMACKADQTTATSYTSRCLLRRASECELPQLTLTARTCSRPSCIGDGPASSILQQHLGHVCTALAVPKRPTRAGVTDGTEA